MKQGRGDLSLPLAVAVVLLLLGLSLLIWPGPVISVFPPLLGAVLILVGMLSLSHAIVLSRRGEDPGFKVVQGIVNVMVGLVFIAKKDVSLAFLTILFGLYILVSASVNFSAAIKQKKAGTPWVSTLLESLLECIFGLVLLFGTFSGRELWIRILGIYFILSAINIMIALLSMKKSLKKKNEQDAKQDED